MKVEIYSKTKELCTHDKQEDNRSKLCHSLGLDLQLGLSEENKIDKFYDALLTDELFIWKKFLPKVYSRKLGQWKDYCFDTIPYKVLEEVSFANSLHSFADLQIWTPERNRVDPLVIGIIGAEENALYYLISRWGESLKSFVEITEIVFSEKRENESKYETIPDIAKKFMNKIILDKGGYLAFQGKAFFSSKCCKSVMYKFTSSYCRESVYHLCVTCGNYNRKKSWLY